MIYSAEAADAAAAAAAFLGKRVLTRNVLLLIVRVCLQLVHLPEASIESPLIPNPGKTSPKNTLFSTPQLGHGPVAIKGSLKKILSVTVLDIIEIGNDPIANVINGLRETPTICKNSYINPI